MKKEMSLSAEKLILNTVYGLLWILYGVLNLFDNEIVSFIAAVVLLVAILLRIVYERKKGLGMSDEMSEYHLLKAKAETLEIIAFFAILLFFFREFFELGMDLIFTKVKIVSICAFLVGFKEALVGILFAKYEKEGE